jgi:two-component system response regulator LytT
MARPLGREEIASVLSSPVRVAVVEDEQIIARRLLRLLRRLLGNRLERLDHLPTLHEAFAHVGKHPIDLLFLDLNLYGEDGFRILREAAASSFQTIIVSAHGERALEAFEYGVLDFVPKPFDEARLRKALGRVESREEDLRQRLRNLAVRRSGEIHLIPVDELSHIRGSGDYSELHTKNGAVHLHNKTLTALALLLPAHFERVHRSVIVDLRQVKSFLSEAGSRYFLRLVDGTRLPVSREKVQGLRARWG